MENDELWTSSSSAQQIRALVNVEKDIARLLKHAASSLLLLKITEEENVKEEEFPQGEERSELFVEEATSYFQTLDSIQVALRKALANVRERRITPSSINAPPSNFIPPSLGAGLLPSTGDPVSSKDTPRPSNLQEARAERDAWRGIAETLSKMQAIRTRQDDSDKSASTEKD